MRYFILQRRAIAILLLSVAIPLLWHLDANPLLYFYDIYVTGCISSSYGIDDGPQRRRSFPPGSIPTLQGKTVWITGASSGIGAELALQLARAGVGHLILSGRRRDKLEYVATTCREAYDGVGGGVGGGWTSVVGMDEVGDGGDGGYDGGGWGDCELPSSSSTCRVERKCWTAPYVLVLNAGRYHIGPAYDTDHDVDLADLVRINYVSPIRLAHGLMIMDGWKYGKKRGHVVAISSLMGRGTSPLNSIYSSTKHAMRAYFLALAAEERSWLRVDVVLPGAVDTGLWEGAGIASTTPSPSSSSSSCLETDATKIGDGGRRGGGRREDDDTVAGRRRRMTTTLPRPPPYADDRSKMSVRRCVRLIVSSMIGPSFLFQETWISNNPGLLWIYIASYMPNTFALLSHVIAPLRMDIWRERGEDALYLPTLVSHMWGCFSNYLVGRVGQLELPT
ncbi:hypothetical protein ACHAXA_005628 [Cyclostephanos tholiformis]|uniref:Uncharacterized protein n=1 Tax=Cyclostephanos tholiformis TaxID=382380 RepID=A0ABD3RS13_9STRA